MPAKITHYKKSLSPADILAVENTSLDEISLTKNTADFLAKISKKYPEKGAAASAYAVQLLINGDAAAPMLTGITSGMNREVALALSLDLDALRDEIMLTRRFRITGRRPKAKKEEKQEEKNAVVPPTDDGRPLAQAWSMEIYVRLARKIADSLDEVTALKVRGIFFALYERLHWGARIEIPTAAEVARLTGCSAELADSLARVLSDLAERVDAYRASVITQKIVRRKKAKQESSAGGVLCLGEGIEDDDVLLKMLREA